MKFARRRACNSDVRPVRSSTWIETSPVAGFSTENARLGLKRLLKRSSDIQSIEAKSIARARV